MSRRRWRSWWWRRALLGAYITTIAACACGISGHVPFWVAWRIMDGNPAYAAGPTVRAATERATAFGVKWAHAYNKAAYIRHDPWRIHQIECKPYDGTSVVCLLLTESAASPKPRCFEIAMTQQQYVFDARHARCPGAKYVA